MPGTMQLHASMTFNDLLQEVQRFWTPLPDKPEETPERLLSALWSTACGAPVSVDRAPPGSLPALGTDSLERLRELFERKKAGVPRAHITKRQTFLGLQLLARTDTLIPRQDSESLGGAAA